MVRKGMEYFLHKVLLTDLFLRKFSYNGNRKIKKERACGQSRVCNDSKFSTVCIDGK